MTTPLPPQLTGNCSVTESLRAFGRLSPTFVPYLLRGCLAVAVLVGVAWSTIRCSKLTLSMPQSLDSLAVFYCAGEGAGPSGGVRSISAGYGTLARLAAAEAEAAHARANAGDASGMSGHQLQRAPGGSADSSQRLQNLSFNTYDLVVRHASAGPGLSCLHVGALTLVRVAEHYIAMQCGLHVVWHAPAGRYSLCT